MSAPHHCSVLPVSTVDTYPRNDFTSPGLVHDLDVIDESPIEPQSEPETAVNSKAPSLKDATTASIKEVAAENTGVLDEQSLGTYVVPVLEKGVKTALSKPSSPWTIFRIWYNPYRLVSLDRYNSKLQS